MTSFTEPASGPEPGTMHTLDDIMAVAPAADNTSGALPAEVLAAKPFWSLRTNSAWGLQAGTMPNDGAVTYTPKTTDQPVAPGYHNGSGFVAGDADLVASNIVNGVSLYGVVGPAGTVAAPVPKTGQKNCYQSAMDYDPCACGTADCPPSQDGALEKGVVWPSPRFTDNGDGTVTDNLTGLIWLENADCAAFLVTDGTGQNPRAWGDALAAAQALSAGYCGLLDDSSLGKKPCPPFPPPPKTGGQTGPVRRSMTWPTTSMLASTIRASRT